MIIVDLIILVGLPSSGKTTIGKKLSEKLNIPLIDTDALIIEEINQDYVPVNSIQECYKILGDDKFRDVEYRILFNIGPSRAVLSTGGGIIERKENRILLRKKGTIIYLKTPISVLNNRLTGNQARPIFKDGILETLKHFEKKRDKHLKKVSNFVVNGELTPEEIIEEIIVFLNHN